MCKNTEKNDVLVSVYNSHSTGDACVIGFRNDLGYLISDPGKRVKAVKQDSRLYFLPTDDEDILGIKMGISGHTQRLTTRYLLPTINCGNLRTGEYTLRYDEKSGAYYIDDSDWEEHISMSDRKGEKHNYPTGVTNKNRMKRKGKETKSMKPKTTTTAVLNTNNDSHADKATVTTLLDEIEESDNIEVSKALIRVLRKVLGA